MQFQKKLFLFKNRSSRKGRTVLRLRCVSGPLPHPLCPGGPDLLSHRLPGSEAASRQETAPSRPLILGLQRLRLGLGHHVRPVGAEAQALWAHAQHECFHLSRGAGASPAARGKGANHTRDLDERAAWHSRDTEPQSVLLSPAFSHSYWRLPWTNSRMHLVMRVETREDQHGALEASMQMQLWTLKTEGRFCRVVGLWYQ